MSDKEKFERYEKVRRGGRFNMITESSRAAKAAGLSEDDYWEVISNYSELKEKYGKRN